MKLLANFVLMVCPCVFLKAQPVIDGILNDVQYQIIGVANSNNGYGTGNDIGLLKYHSNSTTLYIGISGTIEGNVNTNNIVLFMDDVSYSGRGSNTLSGTTSSGGVGVFQFPSTCLGGATLDAGFDADYAFAFNKGGANTSIYLDAMRFGSGAGFEYLQYGFVGITDLAGTAAVQTLPFCNPVGSCTPSGSATWAFLDGYTTTPPNNQYGIEIAIPYSSLPGVAAGHEVRFFVLITNQNGSGSDECIPDDPGSNLGCNFSLAPISGQTFYTTPGIFLPVKFIHFNSTIQNNRAVLEWSVANDALAGKYEVERSVDGSNFSLLSTLTPQFRADTASYSFEDLLPLPGKNFYRIRAVSKNGKTTWSNITSISNPENPRISLYPNPAKEQVNINMTGMPAGIYQLALYSTSGNLVWQYKFLHNDSFSVQLVNFPVSLPNGIYNAVISGVNASHHQKIIILK